MAAINLTNPPVSKLIWKNLQKQFTFTWWASSTHSQSHQGCVVSAFSATLWSAEIIACFDFPQDTLVVYCIMLIVSDEQKKQGF